ncbi:MIP/aquaporin family protein [Buchnera aphidicola]|uniref:Glpf n=1 Tax=Buchnera aphidicola str. USDA (Myzus persicae) TaxID=1009856 RepID=W0P3Q1_BUCMP|nr:MIP/aquaporin family protein [Buchnera aphidicola]AHG60077.1 Glpf [Buchnera aphidicola str. USDA (Myzus persicae)]AHG60657.1 Glpf [Buchnera aphidicola str. W106 (Myzus persicae)]AHG61229.1 Glpf [Buchnera aphidicola str. G002 (Myzus persicae)]AHG61802.1 Glpf [Buchnera aphidicola str. F009 (Myzus persicae)]WAI03236.1 MAG: aquaporin family protein [Buchnera aphidicola (Myzus persicae)]
MNFYRKKNIIKQCFVEFFGTGLIIFFGTGCVAATKLTDVHFNQFEISCIWGLGVSISIYFSSSISGAHLNPAITIFLWLSSEFHKRKVLPYIISQIFGSFIFTMLIYSLYYNSLISFENQNNITIGTKDSLNLASIFCVYPNCNNSFIRNSIIEIFTAALFMIILSQFNNKKNSKFLYPTFIAPILIGILVFMINLLISPLNNISLNPARDLGPKIFLSLTGWGMFSFTGGNNNFLYLLIPIIGPILGVNLGGWMHKIIIKNDFLKN